MIYCKKYLFLVIAIVFSCVIGCIPESSDHRQFVLEYKCGEYQIKIKQNITIPQKYVNSVKGGDDEWPKEFPNISIVPMSDLYKKNPSLPYLIYYMIGHDIDNDPKLFSFLEGVYKGYKTRKLVELELKWNYGGMHDFITSIINYKSDEDVKKKWRLVINDIFNNQFKMLGKNFQKPNWMKNWKNRGYIYDINNRHAIIHDGKFVGMIGIHSYNSRKDVKSFDIMYLIGKSSRGKHLSHYAVAKMLDEIFIENKLNKYLNQIGLGSQKYNTIGIAIASKNIVSMTIPKNLNFNIFSVGSYEKWPYGTKKGGGVDREDAKVFEMTDKLWRKVRGDWITKTKKKIAASRLNKSKSKKSVW